MRLPFVSRARYDRVAETRGEVQRALFAATEHTRVQQHNLEEMRKAVHRSEETADSWKALYDAERIRNDRLVEKLLTMKQEGFTTATERQNATPPQPSKIEDAINEKAGANGALRRHLSRWASQRLAMKISEDEIVDALVKWRDPDEDGEGAEA